LKDLHQPSSKTGHIFHSSLRIGGEAVVLAESFDDNANQDSFDLEKEVQYLSCFWFQ